MRAHRHNFWTLSLPRSVRACSYSVSFIRPSHHLYRLQAVVCFSSSITPSYFPPQFRVLLFSGTIRNGLLSRNSQNLGMCRSYRAILLCNTPFVAPSLVSLSSSSIIDRWFWFVCCCSFRFRLRFRRQIIQQCPCRKSISAPAWDLFDRKKSSPINSCTTADSTSVSFHLRSVCSHKTSRCERMRARKLRNNPATIIAKTIS